MKKFLLFISVLFFFTISRAQWFPNDNSFSSGTYSDVGWPAGKTMTIPAGNTVTFANTTSGSGHLVVAGNLIINGGLQVGQTLSVLAGGKLTVNGYLYLSGSTTLTLSGEITCNSMQTQGAFTLANGSKLTVTGDLTTQKDITFPQNSIISIGGTYAIDGSSPPPTVIIDGPAVFEVGTLDLNPALAKFIINSNSVVKAGSVQTSGLLTVNGTLNVTNKFLSDAGNLTLNSSGKINATDVWFDNPNNKIYGIIKAANEVVFHNGPNTMDCPAQIITKYLKNQSGPNPINGSGYIEVSSSLTGNGNALTASASIVANIATIGSGGNPGSATPGTKATACDGTLPVSFGQVQAFISQSGLQVSWTTLSETNNDHFEIEASADGKQFSKIGENIRSKAENGSTASTTSYNVEIPASSVLSVAALGLLAGAFGFRRNKNLSKAYAIVAVALLTVLGFSCSKSSDEINTSEVQDVYVRVIQVDKDGSRKTSDIVKAIKE